MSDIVHREMAARLAHIEAAFADLPDKLHAIRERYNVAADSFRLLQAMIALTPESPARNRLAMAAEIVLGNMYDLANVLSTLIQLQLAASDYRVLVGLMKDDIEDSYKGESQTRVSVYPIGEKIA